MVPAYGMSLPDESETDQGRRYRLPPKATPYTLSLVGAWWQDFFRGLWQEAQLGWWSEDETRAAVDKVERALGLSSPAKILDVPCGDGRIEIARRFSFGSPGRLYLALAAGLTLAWVVSPEQLLSLSVVPRFLAATAVAFAPVFVANLIFAERFRGVGSSVVAFGANFLGAMVGGLLEYGALVVGYRGLLLVVAGLYSLAFLFRPKEATGVPVAEAATGHRPGTDLLDTAAKGDPSTAF